MQDRLDIPRLRIGELSRRTGVPGPTIRGWERRFGFPEPERTAAGYRLYSERDVRSIRRLRELIDSGTYVSQAIERVRRERAELDPGAGASADAAAFAGAGGDVVQALVDQLVAALLRFDATGAHAVLDDAMSRSTAESVICDVALPAVRDIGEQYVRGRASIAQEHFASELVRGRLWNLARGWDRGGGPRVLLALVADELHDLPMLALGLLLRADGWRVTWLGANTPAAAVASAAQDAEVRLVILGMIVRVPDARELSEISELAASGRRLAVVGDAATDAIAAQLRAIRLEGGVREIAAQVGRVLDH